MDPVAQWNEDKFVTQDHVAPRASSRMYIETNSNAVAFLIYNRLYRLC